jgi:Fructose-bisphosphate aldolase class-II
MSVLCVQPSSSRTASKHLWRLSSAISNAMKITLPPASSQNPARQSASFRKRVRLVWPSSIGGHYQATTTLDWTRLSSICFEVAGPLALHASRIPDDTVRRAVDNEIAKINVNAELRRVQTAPLRLEHRAMNPGCSGSSFIPRSLESPRGREETENAAWPANARRNRAQKSWPR